MHLNKSRNFGVSYVTLRYVMLQGGAHKVPHLVKRHAHLGPLSHHGGIIHGADLVLKSYFPREERPRFGVASLRHIFMPNIFSTIFPQKLTWLMNLAELGQFDFQFFSAK